MRRKAPPEVNQFLEAYSPQVRKLVLELRRSVLTLAPDAIEQLDMPAKLIGYGFAKTYKDTICVIMPLKGAVNLGLPRGADLPDPEGLLEGTGKHARHVKITEINQVDSPALSSLL